MLLLKFIRFLFGYVSFSAKGGFPERFINLCRNEKINLWDLKSKNSVISACTDCGCYKRIRHAAKKSGMRVRIEKKHGLPFFLNRHSRRVGVLAGICLCAAVICILSTRIWSIDVVGNESVPSEQIKEVFEELGVKKGVSGDGIDITAVEIAALKELDEISWLNINIDGSGAVIEVREREIIPDAQEDAPSEIVAARDGQIMILRLFSGTQEQKIGNAVLKGDLLISGIDENKDLTVSFCRAKGYVVARTERKVNCKVESSFTAERTVAERSSYILEFLAFALPIGKADENGYKEKTTLEINGVTLPLSLTRCIYPQTEEVTVNLNENQAQLLASLRFFEKCADEFRYLKTESEKITAEVSPEGSTFSGEFICIENIGKEIPLEIEEITP